MRRERSRLRPAAPAVIVLALGALMLAPPGAAAPATRYAAPSSMGTADCSSASNACDLTTAVNGASTGDDVLVLPGKYVLTSTLHPFGNVSVIGQADSRPLIELSGSGSLGEYSGEGSTLSNLNVESTGTQSPITEDTGVAVTHVIVGLHTSATGIAALTARSGSSLANSVVRASGSGQPFGVEVTPQLGFGTEPARLVNDTVVATAGGMVAVDVRSGSLIVPPPQCHPFIGNASLLNVIAHGDFDALQTSGDSGAGCTQNSLLSVAYSNYNGANAMNGPVRDEGHNQTALSSLLVSGLFRAFPTDLHERPGAATIDAGSSTGLEATDLDGNARIIGPAADIGAYEYRPPAAAPACSLRPKGRRVTLSGALKLTVRCSQGAALTFAGSVIAVKRRHGKTDSRTFRTPVRHLSVTAGQVVAVRIKVPRKALIALRHGAHESIALRLTATNANGSSTSTATIKGLQQGRAKHRTR